MPRALATSALSLLLATALALAPLRAVRASDDLTITVWTRDGGIYRGEIVERVPNDHVTIKLATGETKRIEWKDVARDSTGSAPSTTNASTSKPKDDDAADAVVVAPTHLGPRVHLVGPLSLSLEREVGHGAGTRYDIVCRAPCDVEVEAGGGYRVSGDGRSTNRFVLGAADRNVTPHFEGRGDLTFGIVMLSIGTTVAGIGAGWYLSIHDTPTSDPETTRSSRIESGGMVLVGVLAMVVGIAKLATYRGSSVEIDGRPVASEGRRSTFALTPTGFVF